MTASGLLAAVMIVASAAAVGAQARSQPYSGNGDYQVFCSSCHGTEGRGDGVIAKSLTKRPADLTLLAQRHGGTFPEERVFATIDGRQGGGHAEDMPKWADVFARSSESAGPEQAAVRIDTLVKYLQTLQVK